MKKLFLSSMGLLFCVGMIASDENNNKLRQAIDAASWLTPDQRKALVFVDDATNELKNLAICATVNHQSGRLSEDEFQECREEILKTSNALHKLGLNNVDFKQSEKPKKSASTPSSSENKNFGKGFDGLRGVFNKKNKK